MQTSKYYQVTVRINNRLIQLDVGASSMAQAKTQVKILFGQSVEINNIDVCVL